MYKAIALGFMALLPCEIGRAAADEPPAAGGPAPETVRAFDAYVRLTESRLKPVVQDNGGFLWAGTPERRARLRDGGIVCEPRNTKGDVKVTRGLIHDWIGAVFIPRAAVADVLSLVQDYDNHKRVYAPDVMDSRILDRSGSDFKVRLRLFKRKVVTVVLDTDNQIHYEPLAGRDWRSWSHTTRVAEIADARTPRERERRPGDDHGYLWRLNSYWLFRERDGGVYVECEAVSLSRSIPAALAPLIRPLIQSLPKDALTNTMRRTREVVAARLGGAGTASPPKESRTLPFADIFMTDGGMLKLESERYRKLR